ncbi:hypothetical protein JZU71_00125, partial [bacterium]|nr:hypothetical protein [bacterium]
MLIALVARFISLLVAIAVGYALSAWIVELFGFATYLVHFRRWLLVILFSGMLAMSVALLEAMLHQRHAQFCMMVYTGLRCLIIVISLQFVRFDLMALVWIELLANGLAACTGALLMLRSFPVRGWREGWHIVGLHKTRFCRFAAYNYGAQLVFQFFNAEAMKLLVTRLLGMVQAARYGFVYNLADTVQRYLPAQLLLRLVKPVFVSRYQQSRDFAQLNGMARLILKLNLLMLSPIIVFFAVYGEAALRIVSGGKYQDLQWLLVGLLCLLITNSHQQVLSLLASTLERNAMQLHAGLLSLLALPCAVFLVPLFGAPGAIVSSAIGGLIYNTFATIYLRSAGYAYRPD